MGGHWAVEVLREDGQGISTTLLGGADYESEEEVMKLFLKAIVEQDINLRELDCLVWLEGWLCREIVEAKLDPKKGFGELCLVLRLSNFDPRFDRWLWLSESIAFVEGGEPEYRSHKDLTLENVEETIVEEAKQFLKSCPQWIERR